MGSLARRALAGDVGDALLRAGGEAPEPGEIRAAVRGLLQAAWAQHPEIVPSALSLARQLETCLQDQAPAQWAEHLRGLHAGDVVLCAALADGEPDALKVFEDRLAPEVRRALHRFALSEDERDELAQRIWVRLLVGEHDAPPQILRFRGWGSLEAWIRTVSARLALNALRDAKRLEPLDHAPEQRLADNPELAQLRLDRRGSFLEAIRLAFVGLSARHRALLRLRYLDGMTSVALAKSYAVHESTMSRWLAGARDDLFERFGTHARELAGDDNAASELVGAMQSRFGVSLEQLFRSGVLDPSTP